MAKILTYNSGSVIAVNNVPKENGGFGQDVSAGLINDQVAIVSGGAMTVGGLTSAAIPNLDASKISSGVFNINRIPSGTDAAKIQGVNVSATPPLAGQILKYNGTQWQPDVASTAISPLTRILYVDLNSTAVAPTGTIADPYVTISAAISAARTATPLTTTGVRYEWCILISPGSYDEDISFDGTSMHIALMGNGGPFNLGAYAPGTANYAPTNARNITWTITAGNIDSIRHSLRIGTLGIPAEGSTTHIGYNTVPRISGIINVVDSVVGGTTKEVYLSCVIEDFSATGTCFSVSGVGAPTGVTMLYAHRARFKSAISGTQLRLQQAMNCPVLCSSRT